jgi:hypothetical protein
MIYTRPSAFIYDYVHNLVEVRPWKQFTMYRAWFRVQFGYNMHASEFFKDLKSPKDEASACLSKFHEKPCYYLLIIYIKMSETIVVLTYYIKRAFHWQSFPGFVISH